MNNIVDSRLWFYSGIFSGWWCYDNLHNTKLNKIYKDYCIRNNIPTKDSTNIKNKNLQKKIYSVKNFDFVDFDDSDSDDDKNNTNEVIDYIITTNSNQFIIDFDNMKQINVSDNKKQRNIMYIDIPNEIIGDNDKIIKHLKSYNVKGIAGTTFE